MTVVTGYSSIKRRLVTLRTLAMPAQSRWRRQFDPAARGTARPQYRHFFWQRKLGHDGAMEGVAPTDEAFVTPPTSRYSTPEEYVSQAGPCQPDNRPRAFWASARGFHMGERRGPRRLSEDRELSSLEEYLLEDSAQPAVGRVGAIHASPIRLHSQSSQCSPSPVIKEESESPDRRVWAHLEGDIILPKIESDEVETILPSIETDQDEMFHYVSPWQDTSASGSPRLSTTSTDIRTFEAAKPRDDQDGMLPLEAHPTLTSAAPATREVTEIVKVIPRREITNGLSEKEVSTYLEWIAKLGRRMVDQKEGETPQYHSFGPSFYANLKNKGAKSVSKWASEAHIGGSALLSVDKLLIPALMGKHWALLVVSPKSRKIDYYDSLGSLARPHIRLAKVWLAEELGKGYIERDWSKPSGSRGAGPRQVNRTDCGIIACMTARLVVLGRDPMALDCSADGIEGLWMRIEAELSDGRLVEE